MTIRSLGVCLQSQLVDHFKFVNKRVISNKTPCLRTIHLIWNTMDNAGDLAKSLSHNELLEITKATLSDVFSKNSLLSDLPPDITLEEVLSQIAVEHGQSITVFINRDSEPQLKVIIPPTATVLDLKKATARHFEIHQKRMNSKVKISWKYIWRTYDLSYDGIILDNNDSKIDEYGVCNKVTLVFKKRRKNKRNVI